ncbi:MAG: hypothetical protein HDR71_08760 [Lachnospiraceae bacterium]|nr:hypothetical protein [Lachnospiraceae bacterium]
MESYKIIVEILEACDNNGFTSYADVFRYADENNYKDWLECLCSIDGAYIVSKFLESSK